MGTRADGSAVLDDEDEDQEDDAATSTTDSTDSDETNTDDSAQSSDETNGTDSTADDDDEVVVTIGSDAPNAEDEDQTRAPEWVRELRKANREKDRQIRELQAQVSATKQPKQDAAAVGDKPTLEGCDYDPDRFEAELDAWKERKREADERQRKAAEAEAKAQQEWQAKLDAHAKAKGELKVKDYDDAEALVDEQFSQIQNAILIQGSDNSALVKYAIGKNPKKLKELASITDPVKFAFAVARLETQLKVQPRKAAPMPEKVVRGSAPIAGSVDSQLERLRADAERTGDYTKVHQYKQQLKAKQK